MTADADRHAILSLGAGVQSTTLALLAAQGELPLPGRRSSPTLASALQRLGALAATGSTIVGLGQAAQATLRRAWIPHLQLIHPAARGRIRSCALYRAHVAAVLACEIRSEE